MAAVLTILLMIISCSACAQDKEVRTYGYKIEEVLPHDASAYTQGLFFYKGELYETAGQYGESCLRKVDLKSGKVLKRVDFERRFFLEGSCVLNDRLFILSWKENTCFVYDPVTFKELGKFRYPGEGWGMTTDGKHLIISDGTSTIRFRDPSTFMEKRSITVTLRGQKVNYLNELEYIDGEIWANVYTTDLILRINPETGAVKSVINCSGLLPRNLRKPSTDVLNGIAYDGKTGNVYLTGKYWPKMYRISLKEK